MSDETVREARRRVEAAGGGSPEDNVGLLNALAETLGQDAARREVAALLRRLGVTWPDPGLAAVAKTVRASGGFPSAWKRLIEIQEFSPRVRDAEHAPHAVDDREPFQDDLREVRGEFPDGATWRLALMSGQSNYWGGFVVDVPDGRPLGDESEPIESFDAQLEEFDARNGVRYVLDLEAVSPEVGDVVELKRGTRLYVPGDGSQWFEKGLRATVEEVLQEPTGDLYRLRFEDGGKWLARPFQDGLFVFSTVPGTMRPKDLTDAQLLGLKLFKSSFLAEKRVHPTTTRALAKLGLIHRDPHTLGEGHLTPTREGERLLESAEASGALKRARLRSAKRRRR